MSANSIHNFDILGSDLKFIHLKDTEIFLITMRFFFFRTEFKFPVAHTTREFFER